MSTIITEHPAPQQTAMQMLEGDGVATLVAVPDQPTGRTPLCGLLQRGAPAVGNADVCPMTGRDSCPASQSEIDKCPSC